MAGVKSGQIGSSDNGTNIPGDTGFSVNGPFDFEFTGGTTISAKLEKMSSQGNWHTVPHPDNRTTLTGADAFPVNYARGGLFRINVTTATGTWDWSATEHK